MRETASKPNTLKKQGHPHESEARNDRAARLRHRPGQGLLREGRIPPGRRLHGQRGLPGRALHAARLRVLDHLRRGDDPHRTRLVPGPVPHRLRHRGGPRGAHRPRHRGQRDLPRRRRPLSTATRAGTSPTAAPARSGWPACTPSAPPTAPSSPSATRTATAGCSRRSRSASPAADTPQATVQGLQRAVSGPDGSRSGPAVLAAWPKAGTGPPGERKGALRRPAVRLSRGRAAERPPRAPRDGFAAGRPVPDPGRRRGTANAAGNGPRPPECPTESRKQ